MAWYRFHAQHGPGHQSSDEDYIWLGGQKTKEELEDEWHSWCDRKCIYGCVGDADKVRRPPKDERKRLLQRYTWQLEGAKAMIRRLA